MHQLSAVNQEVDLSAQAFFRLSFSVLLHDVSLTLKETQTAEQFRISIHIEGLW